MSAISGIVGWDGAPVGQEVVALMAAAASHRGPDGAGMWCRESAAFCHQALHVTAADAAENQPLSGDGLTVTADARIDNRDELAALLSEELSGRAPTTSALLLAGYRRWGSGLPARILGDFAFVVWDMPRRRVLAARDPMGLRSLYYRVEPSRVILATEVKQILAVPGVPARISERAVAAHLLGESKPVDWTFYEGISMLAPGHTLEVSPSDCVTHRFWRPEPDGRIRYVEEEDYAEAFQELLRDAVRCRMQSDSPVGVFLSGGVDSGAVAATGGRLLRDTPSLAPELRAYSFAFDQLAQCDEREVSRGIVDAYDLPWTQVPADDAWPLRDEADDPPDRDAPTHLWYGFLWRRSLTLARSMGTVVLLGGDRGDLVGGESVYDHTGLFWQGQWKTLGRELRYLARTQNETVRTVARRSLIKPLSRALWPESAPRRWLRRVRGRRAGSQGPRATWIRPEFLEDQGAWETQRTLATQDRIGPEAISRRYQAIFDPSQMAGFVESERMYARYGTSFVDPFSDRRITEFVLAIPQRVVNRPDDRKRLIKRSMRGVVPDATAALQRKVSPGPLGERGLREKEVETVRGILRDAEADRRGWIDGAKIASQYEAYVSGARLPPDFWPTLSLEMWLRRYWT